MNEFDPPEAASAPALAQPKTPVSAYLMGVLSGTFVAFGVLFLAAFSHLFVGDLLATAPKPVLTAVPYAAIGLGLLTAWQTVSKARRKAVEGAGASKP